MSRRKSSLQQSTVPRCTRRVFKGEAGPFFIVEKFRGYGRDSSYLIMSETELVRMPESYVLASGYYDTQPEAEFALKQGLADGTYVGIYDCGLH